MVSNRTRTRKPERGTRLAKRRGAKGSDLLRPDATNVVLYRESIDNRLSEDEVKNLHSKVVGGGITNVALS